MEIKIDSRSICSTFDQGREIVNDLGIPELAHLRLANNAYFWQLNNVPGENWKRFRDADADQRRQIASKIDGVRKTLEQNKYQPEKIKSILTTPDDNQYIFFCDNGKELRIVITAWGFRLPANGPKRPTVIREDPNRKQSVTLLFTEGGESCPNRRFKIAVSPDKVKDCIAGDDGRYNIGLVNIGNEFMIMDDLSDICSTVVVEKGKQVYEITIPEIEKEEIVEETEEDHDNDIDSDDDIVIVNNDDVLVEENKEDDDIVEESPVVLFKNPVLIVKDSDGNTVADYPVAVAYKSEFSRIFSDANGRCPLQEMSVGDCFEVTDGFGDRNRQSFTVAKDKDEYVYTLDYTMLNGPADITVNVVDEHEKPITEGYVIIKDESFTLRSKLDSSGRIFLSNGNFKRNLPLSFILVQNGREYTRPDFRLIDNEDNYTVQIDATGCCWLKIVAEIASVAVAIASFYVGAFVLNDLCRQIYKSILS